MNVTKLQLGTTAAVIIGAMIGLVLQQHTIVALRETSAGFQEQLAERTAENTRLAQAQTRNEVDLSTLRAEIVNLKSSAETAANRPNVPSSAPTATSGEARPGLVLPMVADTEANRQKKAQYHGRYDPFFAQRGLTPEQVSRIMDLFILQDEARGICRYWCARRECGETSPTWRKFVRSSMRRFCASCRTS